MVADSGEPVDNFLGKEHDSSHNSHCHANKTHWKVFLGYKFRSLHIVHILQEKFLTETSTEAGTHSVLSAISDAAKIFIV